MAEVSQRTWKGPGRGKRKAWGYTVQMPCQPCSHVGKAGNAAHPKGTRQVKSYRAEWTKEDAEKELAAFSPQDREGAYGAEVPDDDLRRGG